MQQRKHKTVTRADIAAAVATARGLPRSDGAEIVSQVIDTIKDSLMRGEPVLLSGFGKFSIVPRAARRARNVRAGHEILVGPRLVIVFKPSVGVVETLSGRAEDKGGKPPSSRIGQSAI